MGVTVHDHQTQAARTVAAALVLTKVQHSDVSALREKRRRAGARLEPGFYRRLTEEATPFLVVDEGGEALGYVLLVERQHSGHSHLTVVELYLEPAFVPQLYENLLDLVRSELAPSAYLVRTDDCLLSSALLARGLQVEPVALVMLAGDEVGAGGRGEGARPVAAVELVPFGPDRLAEVEALVGQGSPEGHAHSDALSELRALAQPGLSWALVREGKAVAVVARSLADNGTYALIDYAVAHAPEPDLARGLQRAAALVRKEGLEPAAVIDAQETVRHRIFRMAGYYTASAFVVFYDPAARRPSVGVLNLSQLRTMMSKGESFRLVDVLGEAHWKEGHLPGAEWIDFRGLAREARRRFRPDETIVVYCNGFT